MQGISLHELRLAIISILLYEAGRLLVFWWYKSGFREDELELDGSCQKPLRKPGKSKSKSSGICDKGITRVNRKARNVGGLKTDIFDQLSQWYGFKGGHNIQTSFFGGVVEYWRSYRSRTDSRMKRLANRLDYSRQYTDEGLDDIQGLGIRHPNLHGLSSASTFDCWPEDLEIVICA